LLVIPAIDIRGGQCVRLRQGDYARETVFSADPAETAARWAEHARLLHVVDLDGARAGRLVNLEAIRRIVAAAREKGADCELGGGVRSEADIEVALEAGVRRIVIGTKALKEPEWFAEMAGKYQGVLLLGLDAKDGKVATEGWLETSECRAVDLAQRFEELPIAGIVYTDIARDGMMEGPNFAAIEEMTKATRHPVIASGGVTTIEDVRRLCQLNVEGCIIGRALYEGTIDLAEAMEAGTVS
jgi:phosphoribosylformimino-5-aminoimidazole carboxamide ribotide isomerase